MLSYPENSAGAMMTTEYASLPEDIVVSEALCRLRQQAPNSETIYYVFVVDSTRHLHGVISLRELILGRPSALLADLMTRDLVSVSVQDDQDEAAKLIARFDLLALPVLDEDNRLSSESLPTTTCWTWCEKKRRKTPICRLELNHWSIPTFRLPC